MSTTSTVPAVLTALVAKLNVDYAALPALASVKAHEAWPGPASATSEMLVLGEITWGEYDIPTIKAGRKARDENWSVAFEVWVVGSVDTSPSAPAAARTRAFQILAVAEDLLANDPTANTDFSTVQWVQIRPKTAGPHEFKNGWAYIITGLFDTQARLS